MNETQLLEAYGMAGPEGTEDDLLAAVTDALTLTGWRWMHIRRSDLAVVMGHAGWPDVIACKGGMLLALELKSERGRPTGEQVAWLRELGASGIVPLIIRPSQLDTLLEVLTTKPGRLGELVSATWGARGELVGGLPS